MLTVFLLSFGFITYRWTLGCVWELFLFVFGEKALRTYSTFLVPFVMTYRWAMDCVGELLVYMFGYNVWEILRFVFG